MLRPIRMLGVGLREQADQAEIGGLGIWVALTMGNHDSGCSGRSRGAKIMALYNQLNYVVRRLLAKSR